MTKRFLGVQLVLAVGAIAIAVAVLYVSITTNVIASSFYPFKLRVALGALVTIGGMSFWMVWTLLKWLGYRHGDVSYLVTNAGNKESFKKREEADARISLLVSQGVHSSDIKLGRVTMRIDSKRSVVESTEDLPLSQE